MFVIICPYFDLDAIYSVGLGYRWNKICEKDYIVFHKEYAVRVIQQKERILFECSEQQFFDIWYDYFDIGTDYEQLYYYTKQVIEFRSEILRAKGLHFLKLDLFEALVYSLLETGPIKSRQVMNHLSINCGSRVNKHIKAVGRINYNLFPEPIQIIENKNKIKGLGIKKDVLLYVCKLIENNQLNLNQLKQCDSKKCLQVFKELSLSSNIAKRFLLYGLNRFEVFPNDKPIRKMLKKYEMTKEDFFEFFINDKPNVKNNAGVLYQQLLFNLLKKEV